MAQLSDDVSAFGGKLQRLDDALDHLQATLKPVVGTEALPLSRAVGRVLAKDVISKIAVPGYDNSAVDGYAVRHADLSSGETRMPVGARVPAGQCNVAPIERGEAVRIFTGAMMPEGADTVYMQEDVRVEAGTVILPAGLKLGANRRFAGEDFAAGARVIDAGQRLSPQHVAAFAAVGCRELLVRKPLRVAIFSTGEELVDASTHVESVPPVGAQFDANRPMLAAFLAARGMEIVDLGILRDNPEAIAASLVTAAADCNAILTSGGVSTGEEDHVKAAVAAVGSLDFWRLAIKPGRPIAMGNIGGRVFLGMPGNPAAVFVTFTRFVGPVLDMLAGARPVRPVALPVVAGFSYRKKADRREYVRVRLIQDKGAIVAHRFPKDGAALISSLIESDGLAELPEEQLEVKPGDQLGFLPFSALMS